MKQCTKCQQKKEITQYNWKNKRGDRRNSICKDCQRAYGRLHYQKNKESYITRTTEWAKDNPEARKQIQRNYREINRDAVENSRLMFKYKITLADVQRMREEQDNCCAICQVAFEEGNPPHVDHIHKTGAIRGLLCGLCNRGIGCFGDSPVNVLAAAEYLTRSLYYSSPLNQESLF